MSFCEKMHRAIPDASSMAVAPRSQRVLSFEMILEPRAVRRLFLNCLKIRLPKIFPGMGLSHFPARAAVMTAVVVLSGCTQESQNKMGRAVANITGMDGVCDIYAGEKLVMRFIKVDKLTTGVDSAGVKRAYRYGYGYLDSNFNMRVDDGEKKVYFEVSDYSTSYVFYENPE